MDPNANVDRDGRGQHSNSVNNCAQAGLLEDVHIVGPEEVQQIIKGTVYRTSTAISVPAS